jgi:hypothetical protein
VLWDFLRDVANNLNRKKQGHRFSKNTKSFCQAMKVYGGRCMCDLFSLNFGAPSFSSVKRDNKRGVRFIAREHAAIFLYVADIYVEAKAIHGINGSIPVILAEDETKVKDRITWESHNDVWLNFVGQRRDTLVFFISQSASAKVKKATRIFLRPSVAIKKKVSQES